MEENFLIKIKKLYSLEQSQQIVEIINLVKYNNVDNSIYDINFAINLANDIIDNKLDYKSVIVGLYYPLIKNSSGVITGTLASTKSFLFLVKTTSTFELIAE